MSSQTGVGLMARVDLKSLKNCFLFEQMNAVEIDTVSSLFKERKLEKGKTVFVEQMPGESLYLISEGSVRITKLIAEGDEKTLVTLSPGDVFGEMAILDGSSRSATARVETDTVLLSVSKSDFEKLCKSHPGVALKIMRNIICVFSKRIRENNDDYREMLMWSLSQTS
jgi:CRP-like cAMP-binding protein